MASIDLDFIVAAVAESKRYRHVAPAVIARLAAEELPKSVNAADAEKRTKRRLHQVFGAYHTPMPWDKLLARLAAAKDDRAAFRTACAEVMRGHASTAERLPELATFYERIFAITGVPNSVLDLACGLNPLALPWMNLPAGARYVAGDIDVEMARFLDGFFALTSIEGRAELVDLVAGPPAAEVDVALVLKTLPCLRHQIADVGPVLDRIRARWLVVSFPARSLGNRE
ncbi:MAG: 16S rRNA methyltransferase, partial [Phycisphaerae bacterium]